MILCVSSRTDIIAFYTTWFLNRMKEGYVDVRNPFYPKKISRIYFEDVDMYIFCTKNPIPILPYLKNFDKPILFHVTLTPYLKDIEPNVIEKNKIVEAIKEISTILGKENVYVRYDPILVNSIYTIDYHIMAFQRLCELLRGYVEHIVISFVDLYKNVLKNATVLNIKDLSDSDYDKLGKGFQEIAEEFGMKIQTCFEKRDFSTYGFLNEPCFSKELVYKMTGRKFPKWKARNCGCVEVCDIGAYNTCNHLCKYCYANYDEKRVNENIKKHDVNSSLLLGHIHGEDEIVVRKK